MLHIKDLIIKKLNKWENNIDEKIICKGIEKIIKEKSTAQVEVLFYKNKSVYVKCPNHLIANELYLIQETIKNKVNKIFRKEILKKIIIKTK